MDRFRTAAVALIAVAVAWLAQPLVARSDDGPQSRSDDGPQVVERESYEYTAQCFVDNFTERGWCERRSDFARLVDCTDSATELHCRYEHLGAMGKAGWELVRQGGGSYRQWYEAPLFFYRRTTVVRTEGGSP